MDVCPVGAITTRDYRFKSRPWDNLNAADTICTLCAKGCNTTAWIKAKPEWAKGSRLIRFTPRFNPAVNGYWMCDIGRFDYHWIESERRLRRPLVRTDGLQQPVAWHEVMPRLHAALAAAGQTNPDSVRFLVSAHASLEELFLFRRLAERLISDVGTIGVSWRVTEKNQPPQTTFKVSSIDAPNVEGARALGLGGTQSATDPGAFRAAVEAGNVSALYVFDPGPEGSIGDTSWIVKARADGKLPLLIVQGVVLSELSRLADFVLPGASFVEKEASYVNEQGRLQTTSRTMPAPGEALEDWQILVNLSDALGVPLKYQGVEEVRADIQKCFPTLEMSRAAFNVPVPAKHWLQASNPSERWKWDFMFQDLPPVKGTVDPSALPPPPGVIPLTEVK
jgi:NADH-quinone oxidoreductase subunit G